MRINFIALFLLCLTVNGFFLETIPKNFIASGTCDFDNSYTRHLKANKVKLFPKPLLFNPGKCGNEWPLHGTCCNVKSIDQYDVMQRYAAVQLLDKSVQQVEKMSLAVTQYLQGFKSYLANEKLSEKKALYVENGSKNLLQEQKIELSTRMLSILEPIRNWLWLHELPMIRNQETCVRKLQNVRSSSVCFSCSGRAHLFFTGNSLNVHEDTCRDLIKECSNSWWYLINYLDQINRFNRAISEIEAEAGITMKNSVGLTKELLNWADENHLRSNLVRCHNGSCEFQIAKSICENFVSIEKPIYLQRALNVIDGILSYSDKIRTDYLTAASGLWGNRFSDDDESFNTEIPRGRYGRGNSGGRNGGGRTNSGSGSTLEKERYLNHIRQILRFRRFDGYGDTAPGVGHGGVVGIHSGGSKKSKKGKKGGRGKKGKKGGKGGRGKKGGRSSKGGRGNNKRTSNRIHKRSPSIRASKSMKRYPVSSRKASREARYGRGKQNTRVHPQPFNRRTVQHTRRTRPRAYSPSPVRHVHRAGPKRAPTRHWTPPRPASARYVHRPTPKKTAARHWTPPRPAPVRYVHRVAPRVWTAPHWTPPRPAPVRYVHRAPPPTPVVAAPIWTPPRPAPLPVYIPYRRHRGRKLLKKPSPEKKAPQAAPAPPAVPTAPSAGIVHAVMSTISYNPLLCSSAKTCIADKVILTASKCGSVEVKCTSAFITHP
jgi:hypothetical protein